MKNISIILLGIFIVTTGFTQSTNNFEKWNWITLNDSYKSRPTELVNNNKSLLGLNDDDNLLLLKTNSDNLGFEHLIYNQYHRDVKVEGAKYMFHNSKEKPFLGNGRLVYGIEAGATPAISSAEAFDRAKDYMQAESFYWEHPEMEQLIKRIEQNPEATYLPTGELVFAEKNYSQNGAGYSLAWKFDISSFGKKERQIVFVDARNGSILFTLQGVHDEAVESTGITRYSGERSFISDLNAGIYSLFDETRSGGILTLNNLESDDHSDAVDFTNNSSFWDIGNEAMDDAAIDAHWGMTETYDYYMQEHNRDSYNNAGSLMLSYIHYDQNWFNAQWTGSFMRFGDGGNNPLTSIDVVAHEFTHGVTQFTAGLIYQNESGALNESFSDIFGSAVEFFALGEEGDWLIGKENFTLRSMSNPNSFGDPDTYKGANWVSGSQDNGGVHTNSGVQNYWFYLLSEGGTGVNSNGDAYNVEGIGIEAAAAIAYRNLSVYLSPGSDYENARLGALQSAEDLYGECSFEALQTLMAWYAVGVGSSEFFADLAVSEIVEPISGCGFGTSEILTIEITNNDMWCSNSFEAGTLVRMGYSIDDGEFVLDSTILNNDLNVGETMEFTFSESVDLSQQGNHQLNVWVNSPDFPDLEPFSVKRQIIENNVILDDGDLIGFEDKDFSPDSFAVFAGIHTDARISISAENTGSRGFRMTGRNVDSDNIEFEIPDNEADNFLLNPEYGSKICFCVDATDWENVRLSFDLQQTHSEFYLEEFGQDFTNFVSSMRITVDDVQIGDQYHPITYEDDPYLTHFINLDVYAGTDFDLCFESKTFLSRIDDPVSGSMGDNVYLDNISLFNDATVSIDETDVADFSIAPNPSSGVINIEMGQLFSGTYSISVVDVLGREVYAYGNELKSNDRIRIDLASYPKGIYSVVLKSNTDFVVKRVILE